MNAYNELKLKLYDAMMFAQANNIPMMAFTNTKYSISIQSTASVHEMALYGGYISKKILGTKLNILTANLHVITEPQKN